MELDHGYIPAGSLKKDFRLIKRRKFPRIYVGWGIVATGSFLNFWGIGYNIFGLSAIFKPISAELGLTRTVTSAVASISRFGGGIEAPITGWLTDKIGPKKVILFGVSIFGLGLILMNYVNSLWAFYLVWGFLMGLGLNTSSGIPMNVAITNWFVKKRGLALGVRYMISGAFALPIIVWLIETQGWRIACVVGGLVMLAVGLILTKLFVKDHRPEYYGMLPDGAQLDENSRNDKDQAVETGEKYAAEVGEVEFTFRQALKTPTYWLLILSQVGPNLTQTALLVHFIPLLTDMGISTAKAATIITVTALANPVARFLGGILLDRIGKNNLRFLVGGSFLLQAGGISLFIISQTEAMVYPFFILYYITISLYMIAQPVIAGRYFGRKAIGAVRGSSMTVSMPVAILAPVYLGWVYDTTGSYTSAFTVLASALAISALFMFLAKPPKLQAEKI